MFKIKNFAYGFLTGCIIIGALWFTIGRINLPEIKQALNRVNGDYEVVQRDYDEVRIDADGFAGDISEVGGTARNINNRSRSIGERFAVVDGNIRHIAAEVDKVEEWNRQSIKINGRLGRISREFRDLSKKSGIQN